jgi:outer membrane protein
LLVCFKDKNYLYGLKKKEMIQMIKKGVLTLAALCMVTFAQAQKIAHLSLDSLISLMPETKSATEAANNYLKGLEQELTAMQSEFEGKYQKYLAEEAGMNDLLKKTKQEDLQQLQNRIQDFRAKAEIDFKQKQAELTAPIMDKAKKGIEAVAKESGYKYVLDTSLERTSVLYSEASDDILMAVKKKLDTMPLANIPGGTSQQGIKMPPPAGAGKTPQKGK